MSPNRPFDDDNDDLPGGRYTEHRANPDRADREISLGTPTILGIFFALALVCALFFGFGYAMGHKSSPPAAGSLAPHSSAPAQQANADPTPSPTPSQTSPTQTATVSLAPPATPKKTVAPADRMIVGDKPPAAAPPPTTNNQQPTTAFVVQVAAVSSQEVADILLASLQKKGYTVAVHREPQDKLLHVQIGPFNDRKQADAMQKRVLADGFNAIVK